VSHSDERGTLLAWSRFVDLDFTAARIVVGRPNGGPVTEVTHSSEGVQDIDPKFSPDGSRILFERDLPDGTTQIVIVKTNGTHETVLPLNCTDPCAADVSPTWAPDGEHVYFTRVVGPFDQPNDSATSAVLWRARIDGSGLTRISQRGIDGVYEDYLATFAPAGYMIFLRLRNSDIKSAAFRRDPDGRTTQLTPYSLDADELSVSTAPFGPGKNTIVFETFGHGAPNGVAPAVATVPATCSGVASCSRHIRFLTSPNSLPDQHFNPAWSPDGRQIAFVRFSFVDPGPAVGDIWRMDWNGRHQRAVSTSPLFEFRPAWGPASRR
jgi:dipeptidyl aminopeptidase/acylaminoacyl peptidase